MLALVPNEWPVDVVSSFFQRSLRRQLHDRASWQILKSISAGQNLEARLKSKLYLLVPLTLPRYLSGISTASTRFRLRS